MNGRGFVGDGQDGVGPVEQWPNGVLTPADAAALDALVQAGWDLGRVAGEHRERAERALGVLSVIGGGAVPRDQSLEDVVLLRVARLRESTADEMSGLSAEDRSAVDAVVEHRAGGSSSGAGSVRAIKHESLLSLLDTPLAGVDEQDRERLIAATLGRVQNEIDRGSAGMLLETERHAVKGRWLHFADLVSVAALLMIGTAVMWPVLEGARFQARKVGCRSAMATAGIGFGMYGADFRDALPVASSCRAGDPWMFVGQSPERSNSANLFTLVRTGYSTISDLACGGNPTACRKAPTQEAMDWSCFEEVSYSYTIMFGRPGSLMKLQPGSVVIADRSPVMVRARRGEAVINPYGNSLNHEEAGQHVLFGDRSVRWLRTPVVGGGDNIWLPRQVEDLIARLSKPAAEARPLEGTETPQCVEDAFVGP